MKVRPIIAIVAVAVVGFGVYKLGGGRAASRENEDAKKFDDAYKSGLAPVLPGPYVPVGDAIDLSYKVHPLGQAGIWKLSFDGHLLIARGVKGKDVKTWQVLDRDGTVKSSVIANHAYMTSTGKTISFVEDQGRKDYAVVTGIDGKEFKVGGYKEVEELAFKGGFRLGTQGFTSPSKPQPGVFRYASLTIEVRELPIPSNGSFTVTGETEKLGDVGWADVEGTGLPNRLGFFKDGKLEFESIPIPHRHFRVIGSRDLVGISAGRGQTESIPYIRTGPEKYVRLAVPEGVVSAELISMNSSGDYLLATQRPWKGKKGATTYESEEWLVMGGKCYRLDDLHEALFGTKVFGGRGISTHMIDELGDLVSSSENGGFLLERIIPSNIK